MAKTQPDLAQVARIARVIKLESICWREVSAKRFVELTEMPGDISFGVSHEGVGMRDIEAGQIVVLAEFKFGAHSKDSTRKVVQISGTLSLRYSLDEGLLKDFDPDLVQQFAETNGIYNAWPYWRELLQNTASRLGLPGVIAPVFRLVNLPAKKPKKAPA